MATNILMPALSPTMEEGKLAKWLVKEGDTVKSGTILAEIETDKATMEVEAVDEGKIGKIMIAEGTEAVKVGTPLMLAMPYALAILGVLVIQLVFWVLFGSPPGPGVTLMAR